MIAAILATAAIGILMPPSAYHTDAPPEGVRTLQASYETIQIVCGPATEARLGCYLKPLQLIVLPIEDAQFPYRHQCWEATRKHENAHAWGWAANHPDAGLTICYPK